MREEGHTFIVYFDDSLVQGDTHDLCDEAVDRAAEILGQPGFTTRPAVPALHPAPTVELLGFILNSTNVTVSLTTSKAKTRQLCLEAVLELFEV